MRIFALFGTALLIAAAPNGEPEGPINVGAGSIAVVVFANGDAAAVDRESADLAPFELAAIARIWGDDGKYRIGVLGANSGQEGIPPVPRVAPDKVRFKVVRYPGKQTNLIVENGYGQALYYDVVLHFGRKSMNDTTCPVRATKRTIEHWPYRVDSIDIVHARLVPGVLVPPSNCL